MAELLIFGSVGFWLTLAVASILLVVCVENDRPGTALTILTVVLACHWLAGDLGTFVREHLWYIPLYMITYAAIGLLWCWPKWVFLVIQIRREYLKELDAFKEQRDITGELPTSYWRDWSVQVSNGLYYRYGIKFDDETGKVDPPQYSWNRDRIFIWAGFWPWSMIWTLIRDPLRIIFEKVLDAWKTVFDWISRRMFYSIK